MRPSSGFITRQSERKQNLQFAELQLDIMAFIRQNDLDRIVNSQRAFNELFASNRRNLSPFTASIPGFSLNKMDMQIEAAECYAFITEVLTFEAIQAKPVSTEQVQLVLYISIKGEQAKVYAFTDFIHEIHTNHAVVAFSAEIFKQDGSVATIRCHLDRSEQAAKAFKDTVREGKSALLVEYDGTKRSVSDRLKIRLGSTDKEVVRIKVKYSFISQMEIIDQYERNQSGMNGNEQAEDVYDARISNLVYKSDPDRIIYNLTIPLLSKTRYGGKQLRPEQTLQTLKAEDVRNSSIWLPNIDIRVALYQYSNLGGIMTYNSLY